MAGDGSDSSSSTSSLPISNILAVVLTTAAVLVHQFSAYESSRPNATDTKVTRQAGALQDVDSRLWQDPFGAVARYRDGELASGGKPDELHSMEGVRDSVAGGIAQYGSVTVIGVMQATEPYVENQERRRRDRYAVLSALNALNYADDDTQYIGYFRMSDLVKEKSDWKKRTG
jgi:hypothetical protein